MSYLDANVVLRYLLDDDPQLARTARTIIDGSQHLATGIEVVAEIVYVLTRVYGVPRNRIAETLLGLFNDPRWTIDHKHAVLRALDLYGRTPIDIVDAWLVALHETEQVAIVSFDRTVSRMTGMANR